MSEKLLRFLLSELVTVRIRCKIKDNSGEVCGFVSEVPVSRLSSVPTECPGCRRSHKLTPPRIDVGSTDSPFHFLRRTVDLLNGAGDKFEVEFVLLERQ